MNHSGKISSLRVHESTKDLLNQIFDRTQDLSYEDVIVRLCETVLKATEGKETTK